MELQQPPGVRIPTGLFTTASSNLDRHVYGVRFEDKTDMSQCPAAAPPIGAGSWLAGGYAYLHT